MGVHTSAIFKRDDKITALDAARAAAKRAGFSVGHVQDNAPCGIVLGQVDVRKWRDIAPIDQRRLHGQLWASKGGRATVMLHADAPPAAVSAYDQILDAADESWPVVDARKAMQHALLIVIPVCLIIGGFMAMTP